MMRYRAEIDGLRALAVMPVVLFHAGFAWVSGGYVGVDVFFVISGYLITRIILNEHAAGQFSLLHFYERRMRRILPALFVMMAACMVMATAFLMPGPYKKFGLSMLAAATFWSNILFYIETVNGYFENVTALIPLLHTWSLSVEEQFYIVFPLLFMLCWRFARGYIKPLILVGIALSITIAQWGGNFTAVPPFVRDEWQWDATTRLAFYMLPARAFELLIGAYAAFLLQDRLYLAMQRAWLQQGASGVGLACIVYACTMFTQATPFPGLYALVPTLGAVLIILFAAPHTLAARLLSLRPIVWIGLISYSVYLWHQPIFVYVRILTITTSSDWLWLGYSVLSILFGYVSWRFVERPFRQPGRVSRRNIFIGAVVGTLAFAGLGYSVYAGQGAPSRLSTVQRHYTALAELLRNERFNAIKDGTCHFGERNGYQGYEAFVQQWNCVGSGSWRGVMVIGDSAAGDKAGGLRAMGIDIGQITAASCSITPSQQRVLSHCKIIYQTLDKMQSNQTLRGIIVTGQFSAHELTTEALDEALQKLRSYGVPLLFIGSPQRGIGANEYASKLAPRIDASLVQLVEPNFVSADASTKALAPYMNAAQHIYFADFKESYCQTFYVTNNDTRVCYAKHDEEFVSHDGGHFTATAAAQFMKTLTTTHAWEQFVSSVKGGAYGR